MMKRKWVSLLMIIAFVVSVCPQTAKVYAGSGTVIDYRFEDGNNSMFSVGSVSDVVGRGIGKAVTLVCASAGRDSFNSNYFTKIPIFNTVNDYKAATLEGNDFYVETEFDFMSKDVNEKIGTVHLVLNSDKVIEQYKDTTGHIRLQLSGGRMTAHYRKDNVSESKDIGEFKDLTWYRIKIVSQVTGADGQEMKMQKAVYVNGVEVLSNVQFTSENTAKIPYYNAMQVCCDGGLGATMYMDNIRVIKYNGESNRSPEKDRLISLIRKADRMVRDAEDAAATAANTLKTAADTAYAVYTASATTATNVSDAANSLDNAIKQSTLEDNGLDIYQKEEPFVPEPMEYIINNDFEKEDTAPFSNAAKNFKEEDLPYIGKAMYASEKTSTVTMISDTFAPTYLLRNSNSAMDAYNNEGAGCDSVTEFDIKFDKLMANKKQFQVKLHMDTSSDGTPIHRLIFDGTSGKMQISLPGGLTYEDITAADFLKDDVWYRIKIKLHATDAGGNPTNTLSVYVDGKCIASKKKVQSTSAGKVDKYNILTFSGLGSETGVLVDNIKIYKVIAQKRNEPLDYGAPLSVLRKAKALLNTASTGSDYDDYDEQEIAELQTLYTEALENMEKGKTQTAVDESTEELAEKYAIIQPNGYPVDVSGPTFSADTLAEKTTVDVSYHVFSNKYADNTNPIMAAAVLYQEAEGFDGGRSIKTFYDFAQIGASSETDMSVTIPLGEYSEEQKANMFMKTFVWNLNGSYPLTRPQTVKYKKTDETAITPTENKVTIQKTVVAGEAQRRKISVLVKDEPNRDVMLTVLKNGKDYTDISGLNQTNVSQIIEYVGQCRTDANGMARFEFLPSDDNAEYKSRVSGYAYGTPYDFSIYASSLSKIDEIFDELAGTNDTNRLAQLFDTSKNYLDVDEALYNQACANGISIGDILLNMEMKNYHKDDIEKFTKEINAYMKELTRIKNAVNADMISDALDQIRPFVEKKTSYYQKTAQERKTICGQMYPKHSSVQGLSSLVQTIKTAMNGSGSGSMSAGFIGGASGLSGKGGSGSLSDKPKETDEKEASPTEKIDEMFSDMDESEWAKEAVVVLAARGVIDGKENGKFCPNDSITREELVKLAVCAFGFENASAVSSFGDVDVHAWYYPYIASAEASGIIRGVSEDRFGVGEKITREDLAVIMYRAAVLKKAVLSEEAEYFAFDDDEAISDYAREAIEMLAKNKIINGKGANMFMPKDSCTRAEAAKMLYEICKLLP